MNFRYPLACAVAAACPFSSVVAHDGDLDRGFGTNGTTIIDFGGSATALGLAIAPDGKIVLGGSYDAGVATGVDFAVARLTHDGQPDTSFSFDGKTTIAVGSGAATDSSFNTIVQSDGKIVVIGEGPDTDVNGDDSDFKLVRLNTDGTLDNTFSGDGKAYVNFDLGINNADRALDAAQLPNGKLVVVGNAEVTGQGTDFAIARLNADGSRDTTFDGDGRVTLHFNLDPTFQDEVASSVVVDAAGNIFVAGVAANGGINHNDMAIAKLLPNGALDPNFGGDGRVTVGFDLGGNFDDEATELILAPDGSLFMTGVATGNAYDFAAVKLLPDGTPDASFGVGGKVSVPFDLGGSNGDISYGSALQTDGKLVIVGLIATDTDSLVGMARFDTSGQLDPTFGFSGKAIVPIGVSGGALRARIQDGYLVFGGAVYATPSYTNYLAGRVIIDTIFDNGFDSSL